MSGTLASSDLTLSNVIVMSTDKGLSTLSFNLDISVLTSVQYMQTFKLCFNTTECYIGLTRAKAATFTFHVYHNFIEC